MSEYIQEEPDEERPFCGDCFKPLVDAAFVSALRPRRLLCVDCFVLALIPVKIAPGMATTVIQ